MPTPKKGESEKDFVSRCIPYVIHEGTTDDPKQAAAICHSIWRKSKKETKKEMKSKRILMHLSANMFKPILLKEEDEETIGYDRSTILVGDGIYNGTFFPKEELEKAYMTWDRQPINLDHSDKVEDIVGYIKQPVYDRVNNKITVQPVIDSILPKSIIAKGYIQSRIEAGSIPEVSVGVWVEKFEEEIDGDIRLTARNLEGDHLALVTRGACSPQDGCGIGLSDNKTVTIPDEDYVNMDKKLKEKIERLRKELLKEKIKKEKTRR